MIWPRLSHSATAQCHSSTAQSHSGTAQFSQFHGTVSQFHGTVLTVARHSSHSSTAQFSQWHGTVLTFSLSLSLSLFSLSLPLFDCLSQRPRSVSSAQSRPRCNAKRCAPRAPVRDPVRFPDATTSGRDCVKPLRCLHGLIPLCPQRLVEIGVPHRPRRVH